MAYLGSTPTTQSFIAGTDTFSGTGAQVAFTLTRAVNSVNDILVVVNNVDQQPSAYSVSGTTLTFTAAPSSGTNNVYVRYLSTTLQSIGVGDLSVSTDKIQDGAVTPVKLSTGAPNWTDAGLLQFNSGYGSVATAYGCRAWVNFNGTGTVAIRASGNVSSITDGGVGIYTVNFTTAMIDANYYFCGGARSTVGNPYVVGISSAAQTTSALPIATVQNPTTDIVAIDSIVACVSVFR